MINENNFKQKLFDYACEKYGSKFQEFYDKFYNEFPDKYEGLDEELHYKNFTDWLMIEKPLPSTGKTIVEEYAEKHPEVDEQMKQKLLQMRNVVRSKFVVISKDGVNLKLEDTNSKKIYNVVLYADNPGIGRNSLIEGRIHQFGDSFRFAGAYLTAQPSPFILSPNVLMDVWNQRNIKDAESVILSFNSKLTAVLNKYPFQWVDGICNELSVDAGGRKNEKVKMIAYKLYNDITKIVKGLPEKAKEALKLVLSNGGVVRYNQLSEYGDEITYWWNEEPPTSTIGILRLHSLLAVGKMPMKGRLYRVALIPSDLREKLAEIMEMEK